MLVVESNGEPKWAGPITFSVTDEGSMTIQVYAKHWLGHGDLIGELKLESALETFATNGADESQGVEKDMLLYKGRKGGKQGPIGVSIRFFLRYLMPKPTDIPRATVGDAVKPENLMKLEGPPADSPENPSGLQDASKSSAEEFANGEKASGAIESEDQELKAVVAEAKDKIKNILDPPMGVKFAGDVVGGVDKTVKVAKSMYDLWKPLAQKVSKFVQVIDTIAEIHPYAKITWTVLSQPLKIVIEQIELDEDVEALLEMMNEVYKTILLAEPLKMIDAHRGTMKLMCQQTTECALFISEYASRGFGKRIITSFISGYSAKVAAYRDAFEKLNARLRGENVIVTELIVFQISTKTDEMLSILNSIHTNQELDRLPRASNQRRHDGCDIGTRQILIDDIIEWSTKPVDTTMDRVYWLRGVAGCGKSAIAQSVSERLHDQRRCVSFFFNASTQTKDGLDCLYATLSRDLALLNVGWKAALVKAINNCVTEPKEMRPQQQLETFIVQPAQFVNIIGPILIIIDALDESGSYEQRKVLFSTLARLAELPIQFRFLVTSRPEYDIIYALERFGWVTIRDLDSVSKEAISDDILSFVHNRLQKIPDLTVRIDVAARQIADRSSGLFQWASTVCKYIEGEGKVGLGSTERLEQILSLGSYDGLYGLYKGILDDLCAFQPGDKTERLYQTIMGRIISLQEPLSLGALSELWSNEEEKMEAKNILSPMGSLFRGVSTPNEPIQPLHASFSDFLRDKTRSGKYWVNTDKQSAMLSKASLREMQKLLKFNICEIETSYKSNRDIPNLASRVKQIPSHLTYACCFWVDHLFEIKSKKEWRDHLYAFMQRYLLFWLEVLSLLGRVDRALAQLSMLKDWTHRRSGQLRGAEAAGLGLASIRRGRCTRA